MSRPPCEICRLKTNLVPGKVTFLARFPLNVDRCKQWIAATGNKELVDIPVKELNQSKYICSKHFLPGDFDVNKSLLKSTAVPSINISSKPLMNIIKNFPAHTNIKKLPNNMEKNNDHDYCNIKIEGKDSGDEGMNKNDPSEVNENIKTHLSDDESEFSEELSDDDVEKSDILDDEEKSELDEDDKSYYSSNDTDSDLSKTNDTSDSTEEEENSHSSYNNHKTNSNDQYRDINNGNTTDFTEIDNLFKSYAATFKKLSIKLQTMLKLDLAKLFARYEIKNATLNEESDLPPKIIHPTKKSTLGSTQKISSLQKPPSEPNTSSVSPSPNARRYILKRTSQSNAGTAVKKQNVWNEIKFNCMEGTEMTTNNPKSKLDPNDLINPLEPIDKKIKVETPNTSINQQMNTSDLQVHGNTMIKKENTLNKVKLETDYDGKQFKAASLAQNQLLTADNHVKIKSKAPSTNAN